MDPDACLERILKLLRAPKDTWPDEAYELANMVRDLHDWLRNGGFNPKAWINPLPEVVLAAKRANLAKEVYDLFFAETESFEVDNLCAYLSYLLGAILHGEGAVVLSRADSTSESFLEILQKFPTDHEVWKFIEVCE